MSFVAHRATDIAHTVRMGSIAMVTAVTNAFGAGQYQWDIVPTARKRSTKSKDLSDWNYYRRVFTSGDLRIRKLLHR